MKVVFTGGGTGGHFYPLIAVAESIYTLAKEQRMLVPAMHYIGTSKMDERILYENDIHYHYCPSGKLKRGEGIRGVLYNFFSFFKIGLGIIKALIHLYHIHPDVVFSKGGYSSFPTVFATRILRIPLIIHESDTIPGRVTLYAAPFAKKIACSYPDIPTLLEPYIEKIAITGVPIRKTFLHTVDSRGKDAEKLFSLNDTKPVILILGGSQGALTLNHVILESLSHLLKGFQVIHQTGKREKKEVEMLSKEILLNSPHKDDYHPVSFLDEFSLKVAAGRATLIITRAGSGALFEIANWGIPSIIVPIPEDISRDQRSNAYAFAHETGAIVIEQINLAPGILASEIERVMNDKQLYTRIKLATKKFSRPDAADVVGREILSILISHE